MGWGKQESPLGTISLLNFFVLFTKIGVGANVDD